MAIQINLELRSTLMVALIFLLPACQKSTNDPATTGPKTSGTLNLIGLKSDSGYSYKLGYDLDENGDSQEYPAISTLRLFENGVEIGPAHSNHSDIRKYGLGQFSHWGNELYFSTSDNSDPLKNGRKYTYSMK